MSVLQRWFPSIFGVERAAAPVAGEVFGAPGAETEAYGLLASVLPFGQPPKRGSKELVGLYCAEPFVRAVVGRIAQPVAATSWEVYVAKDSKGRVIQPKQLQRAWGDTRRELAERYRAAGQLQLEPVLDHPMLDFLAAGNPAMDAHQVHALTQIFRMMKGEAYWLLERWDSGPLKGLPRYAWPIPPFWVQQTPSVASPTYRLNINSWYVDVPETEIVCFKDADPTQPYGRGAGLMESAADEISAYEHGSKLIESSYINKGMPATIVTLDGGTKAEADRMSLDFQQKYRGVLKAFRTHFTNSKVSVNQLSQTFADMQVLQMQQYHRDVIMEVTGYPKELLGILINANRSTVDTAGFRKEKYCVEPEREAWRMTLQHRVMPEYDERGLVGYVSTVPEDREFTRGVMKDRPSAYSENEVRKLTGHAPLKGKDGDARPPLGTKPAPPTPVPEAPPEKSRPGPSGADPEWARALG